MKLLCSTYHLPLLSLQGSSVSGDLSLGASQLFGLLFNDICDRMGQRKTCNKTVWKILIQFTDLKLRVFFSSSFSLSLIQPPKKNKKNSKGIWLTVYSNNAKVLLQLIYTIVYIHYIYIYTHTLLFKSIVEEWRLWWIVTKSYFFLRISFYKNIKQQNCFNINNNNCFLAIKSWY